MPKYIRRRTPAGWIGYFGIRGKSHRIILRQGKRNNASAQFLEEVLLYCRSSGLLGSRGVAAESSYTMARPHRASCSTARAPASTVVEPLAVQVSRGLPELWPSKCQGLLDADYVRRKTTARGSGSCMSCVSRHLCSGASISFVSEAHQGCRKLTICGNECQVRHAARLIRILMDSDSCLPTQPMGTHIRTSMADNSSGSMAAGRLALHMDRAAMQHIASSV